MGFVPEERAVRVRAFPERGVLALEILNLRFQAFYFAVERLGFVDRGQIVFGYLDFFVHGFRSFLRFFVYFGVFKFRAQDGPEYELSLALRVEIRFGVKYFPQEFFVREYLFERFALQAVPAADIVALVLYDDRALVEDFDFIACGYKVFVRDSLSVRVLAENLLDYV